MTLRTITFDDEQFARDVYDDLAAADNQDVALEEYPTRILAVLNRVVAPEPPAQQPHPDDAAVDAFADAMKLKLAEARAKGRGGWQDKGECSQEYLSTLLRDHVSKGDPRDVANFCCFLWNRGEGIGKGESK